MPQKTDRPGASAGVRVKRRCKRPPVLSSSLRERLTATLLPLVHTEEVTALPGLSGPAVLHVRGGARAAELAASDFHPFAAVRVQSDGSDLAKATCSFANSRHHVALELESPPDLARDLNRRSQGMSCTSVLVRSTHAQDPADRPGRPPCPRDAPLIGVAWARQAADWAPIAKHQSRRSLYATARMS